LSDNAGRIADLDGLAQKLVVAVDQAEEETVYAELAEVLAKITSEYRFPNWKIFKQLGTRSIIARFLRRSKRILSIQRMKNADLRQLLRRATLQVKSTFLLSIEADF
jgi:hypothetical protein